MAETALVTGADGFIGSHVVESFVRQGFSVRAMAMYNSIGTAGWLDALDAEILTQVSIQWGDIRDPRFVRELVEGSDVVAHLAALISIPHSYVAPESYVQTNVLGTLNLLEAVRLHPETRLIAASTSEVYGTPKAIPIKEDHELKAQSPYAASKIAADQLCRAYAASFGVDAVILRPFNTFGPRQSVRAFIPSVLSQMLRGLEVIEVGNIDTQRDYTYVTDTADAFVSAAQSSLSKGETVQLGTGRAVTMREVIDMCREVTGASGLIRSVSNRIRPVDSEVQVLLSNPSKAAARMGWSPTVSLEEGIALTAEWWRRQGAGTNSHRLHL